MGSKVYLGIECRELCKRASVSIGQSLKRPGRTEDYGEKLRATFVLSIIIFVQCSKKQLNFEQNVVLLLWITRR